MSVLSWMFCPRHCYRSTGGVLFFDGAAGLTLCAFATPPAARESPIAWQRLSLPTHPNVNVYRSSLPAILGTPATAAGRTGTSVSIVVIQGSPGMAG